MKAKIFYIALALALVFSMSAVVVPASPALAATEYYVCGVCGNDLWDGLSPTYTSGTNGPKATIQAAVNTAVATDTINVAAGTYNENVIVSVANLTLRGANEGKSAGANPATRGSESIIISITIQSNNVVIDGFRIDSTGSSGIMIVGGTSGHTISNNVVFGDGTGPLDNNRGIEFQNDTSNIVVSDNEFTNWKSGIYVNPSPSYDHDLEVTGNDFHDNFVGIGSDRLNNVSIQYNDFSGNTWEAFGSSNVGTNVQAHNNNFDISNNAGINNYFGDYGSAQVIDASDNWWGHATGPIDVIDDRATGGWYNPLGAGVPVSEKVKYEPYLGQEGEGGGGGGCFIATAAYGTEAAAEIDVLRAFRDEVLLESTVGSQLVEWYYQTSPPVADFISENAVLRTIVRELVIDPMVSVATFTQGIWGR